MSVLSKLSFFQWSCMDVRIGLQRKLSAKELMLLNCGSLEKTLESLLDCQEIKPVHPKGNWSWIFIGRTDVEAETPKLWQAIWRTDSLEKILMLRLTAGEEGDDRGWDSWLASLTGWTSINSVQSLSHVQLFPTPWTAAHQASLSITNSQSLLKLMPIESVMPSNYLIFCHPLLLPPSIFPSIRVFSNESALRIRWPKYWSFSFNISPSNECSGLISFRMDWLGRLAVQGTLKSLLQHHGSKASILQGSAFFIVQLSHPYMTTGKIIALTSWTFAGKVVSLLF